MSKSWRGHGPLAVAIAVAVGGGLLWKGYSSYQENQENQAQEPLQTPVLPNVDNVVGTPRFHARRSPKGYSKGTVESVSFSPDGRTILSANDNVAVKLWDKETGREILTAEEGGLLLHPINGLRFSPDGATVLGAVAAHRRSESGNDQLAIFRLWDTKTGEVLRTFEGQHRVIEEVSFSPDGNTILSASTYGIAELWNASTGQRIRNIELCDGGDCTVDDDELQDHIGHRMFISDASFSPDGSTILSASSDGTVKLWDMATGTLVRTLGEYSDNELDDGILSASFSPNGKLIMTITPKAITFWNVETGGRLHQETRANLSGTIAAFNPNGSTVAISTASFPHQLKILDANTGQTLRTFEVGQFSVGSLAFSPDGSTLAVGNSAGAVSLWNPETGQQLRTLTQRGAFVDAIAFSPDGKNLAIGQGKAVRFWNLVTGEELSTASGHTESVTNVAFGAGDKTIISSTRLTAKTFDAMTGKELSQGEGTEVASIAQNGDSPVIVAGKDLTEDQHWVPVLKTEYGKVLRTFPRHSAETLDATLNPAGDLVAALHRDGVVKLWNAQTGTEVRQFQHQALDSGWGISFSADGKTLASKSHGHIQIWDVATGNPISTLDNIRVITSDRPVFSPDGTMVAAFDREGMVWLWEVGTGKVLGAIGEPGGEFGNVKDVRFNSDGTALVAGYEGGSVKAWDLHRDRLGSLVETVWNRVTPNNVPKVPAGGE